MSYSLVFFFLYRKNTDSHLAFTKKIDKKIYEKENAVPLRCYIHVDPMAGQTKFKPSLLPLA